MITACSSDLPPTAVSLAGPTSQPTATSAQPTATSGQACSDQAEFLEDLTVPDGTLFGDQVFVLIVVADPGDS